MKHAAERFSIEISGLTYSYPTTRSRSVTAPAISDLSMGAQPGSCVALTGPSGCGKSTLLYLAGLMLRPSGGAIYVGGQRVDHLSDREKAQIRAEELSFVFQDALLDPGRTALDAAMEKALYRRYDPIVARDEALRLMERFGVAHRAEHKPGQMSGGQAQRIALCRALLGRPDIVLADEPTGNLDAASSQEVIRALQEAAQEGATVIIATHDPEVVRACDVTVELPVASSGTVTQSSSES